ncbi:hypothetical protein HO173_006374 [Letharia columbiana]|uniref:RRM domain-containing protein n=1 Tax=Letharia columbiana TaxID=112416 RepID=A0A8H6FW00_9LECA|nr:uncharacterized protein HO173_006374 [Letharia columbiana]KAF6235691.1 hypothetical protein HO173_006374 [Letharia columbiana]
MTSSPPSEAPHYRTEALTPESPVPVHIPEPQNIPVLQNQNDIAFNQMSTHMEAPNRSQVSATVGINGLPQDVSKMTPRATESAEPLTDNTDQETRDYLEIGSNLNGSGEHPENLENGTPEPPKIATSKNHLTTIARPFMPIGAAEPLSTNTQLNFTYLAQPQSYKPSSNILQDDSNSTERSYVVPVSQDSDAGVAEVIGDSDIHGRTSDSDVNGDGVNYQALLDNISSSASTAPPAENHSSITTAPSSIFNAPSPGSAQTPIATLPIPAGLPPRPPPQEKPAIHPNYTPGEDIRSYHKPPPQNSNAPTSYNAQPSSTYRPPQGYPHSNGVAPNGLPPPPLATFQQSLSKPNQPQRSPQTSQYRQRDNYGKNGGKPATSTKEAEDEHPRKPEIERQYEEFLHDEEIYVSEGTWDRFPQGSRLFVGNLYTEKVTKRDLFYVFYKYGRIAQISMKSAYGFVQYHDADACFHALQSEQAIEIKGRKIHLEISKPQKNTRNAVATAAGDSLRAGHNRRSRSPDYGRGGPVRGLGLGSGSGGDRYDRSGILNPFERRMRDDYRPLRSPSPRGFRGRDDYRGGRDRSPDRYFRGRSRSPYDRGGRFRSRSPRARELDDEADLPIPRRNPGDVPDVQLVLVDEVDRTFVAYIQQSFRDRGLRCDLLQLPRVSLAAVVKRQMVEGVQAVVKIFRKSQNTGKIPLQVFNRSLGVNNIQFDEYEDLQANVAAELVVRAKSTHLAPVPAPTQYPSGPTYGAPQYLHQGQPVHPQQAPLGSAQANLANLITSLDGSSLQQLLGAMAQNPQTPTNPQPNPPPLQPGQSQGLASLLSNIAPQQPPQQGYQYPAGPPQQQNAFSGPLSNPTFTNNPALSSLLHTPHGRPSSQRTQAQHQQSGQQQSVQDIMAQLAKYQQ